MKIRDLEVGQEVTFDCVLSECSVRKTRGTPPRDYLAAVFTDGIDKLDAKLWNYNTKLGVPATGKVYVISGRIGEYLGKKQITLDKMEESADQDMDRFEPTYCEHPSEIYVTCMNMIDALDPGVLKEIIKGVYEYYKAELLSATGAKGIHHVGHGGNIAHMYEVATIGCAITNSLRILGYTVDRDLVIAGALIHDLGKCWSYDIKGAVIDMSRKGRELEHIILGIEALDNFLRNTEYYNTPEAAALRHIIASHHGELEYGSPVTPCYMEAYVVSYADKISADMEVLCQANYKAEDEGKDLTDKIFVLHNREHILQHNVLKE